MSTRVIIPCRLSYAHIWEPGTTPDGQPGKYSVALLIPKTDTTTLQKIKNAIEEAKVAGKQKLANTKGIVPPNIKTPLRDADEEGKDEAYEGMYYMNANSKTKPGIVNRKVEPILDQEEVYSGCYCNVSVNFYAFNTGTNKGIAAGLGNIQKVKDGDKLAGGPTANEDFKALGDDDDDVGLLL